MFLIGIVSEWRILMSLLVIVFFVVLFIFEKLRNFFLMVVGFFLVFRNLRYKIKIFLLVYLFVILLVMME